MIDKPGREGEPDADIAADDVTPDGDTKSFPVTLTAADIEAHAAEMRAQPWWGLVEADLTLPPCPVCGGRQATSISGTAVCEEGPHQ